MITTDINVICPDNLKLYLIQNRVFNHAHYFSKKDVLDSAFYTYEKEDVLSYALNRNVSFAIAKRILKVSIFLLIIRILAVMNL